MMIEPSAAQLSLQCVKPAELSALPSRERLQTLWVSARGLQSQAPRPQPYGCLPPHFLLPLPVFGRRGG